MNHKMNSRANSFEGTEENNVQYKEQWGYLYDDDFLYWKKKTNVKKHVNIGANVNYL